MATVLTDSTNYENIANSIRTLNGETTEYYPSEMAAAISELSPPSAVLYTAQTLTEEQKVQARVNIGLPESGGSTVTIKTWTAADIV